MSTRDSEKPSPKYKRIVLKLSGEVLRNTEDGEPISPTILTEICSEVKKVYDIGVQVGLVIGGGNIFRGLSGSELKGVDRTTGDYMGMLATVINGLAIMDCLEKMGVIVRLQSAIPMDKLAEPFIVRRATRHLERGRVVRGGVLKELCRSFGPGKALEGWKPWEGLGSLETRILGKPGEPW